MACVTATGELTPSGRSILEGLSTPRDALALAEAAGLPLYRTRAGLRELQEVGYVEDAGGKYAVTARGLDKLAAGT